MKISSKVIRGRGLGKSKLGYATANCVILNKELIASVGQYSSMRAPIDGSWSVKIMVDGKTTIYLGLCGISKYDKDKSLLEIHILDFNEDIYDKIINIEFVSKIRNYINFSTIEDSKIQIEKDIYSVLNYKTCDSCKFCVYQDHGYSNYTVEGTYISCLVKDLDLDEKSFIANNCELYNHGHYWDLDVDGENEGPTDDWIKSELREVKLKNILK